MRNILFLIALICCILNTSAQKAVRGADIFTTIFPTEKTAFTIESRINHTLTYTRYDDTTSISKIQNKTLNASEDFNSARHFFTANYVNFSDTTKIDDARGSKTVTSNTDASNPTFLDNMYMQAIGKEFLLYVRENGVGFASKDVDKLTSNVQNVLPTNIVDGLKKKYIKSVEFAFNENASLRLVESAMVMPHLYGWKEIKVQDTALKKTEFQYVASLFSICGIKAEFNMTYKVKKVTNEKYILSGTGNGIQHSDEELVSLNIGEGKSFGINPKDVSASVEIEVNRLTGLVNYAKYKVSYHHTAYEEFAPNKINSLLYDVDWKCENCINVKKINK